MSSDRDSAQGNRGGERGKSMKDGWFSAGSRLWKDGKIRARTDEVGFRDVRYMATLLRPEGFRGPYRSDFETDAEARNWCEEQLKEKEESNV